MKYSQQDLEILVLAYITKDSKLMDKALAKGINLSHFEYVEEDEKKSYTKALYKIALDYFQESGGSLITSYVIEAYLNKFNTPARIKGKVLILWEEIQAIDIDPNNFHELAKDLKYRKSLRLLNQMISDTHTTLSSDGLDKSLKVIQDGLDQIQTEMSDFGADRHNFDISESTDFFKDEYNKRLNQPQLFKGINCGVSNIDSKTFGWLPGQIIVFMAPSSGGKSVMLLNSAIHANEFCNKKILYMSFEMNSWLCLLRHVSLAFEIPYNILKDTALDGEEFKKIINLLNEKRGKPYFEYDVNMEDPTPEYIDSRIRDLIATKGKPDLLVVDYIGNMTVRNAANGAKDWELQSQAIKQLFIMAKRYNIPVITAQQINREAIRDSRKSKEANKFMSYDQAAASGGQVLMHLCTYAIAMEPNREKGYCVLHPVKMRDAWFHPFPVRIDPDYNKVRELSIEEQQQIMGIHAISNGDKTAKPVIKPSYMPEVEEEDMDLPFIDRTEDELSLPDWTLG